LMDYYGPLASGVSPRLALQLLDRAKQLRLDQHGASLAIVQTADGRLQIEARVLQGDGLNSYLRVFSLEHPNGEWRALDDTREVGEVGALLPQGAVILTAEDLLAAENPTLDAVFAAPVGPGDWLPAYQFSTSSSVRAEFSPSDVTRNVLEGDKDPPPRG